MSGTYLAPSVPEEWRSCLSAVPGWWHYFDDAKQLVRVRRAGVRFVASVYPAPFRGGVYPSPGDGFTLPQGRTVLGAWPTVRYAVGVAKTLIYDDGERLCSPDDIDRVRRENAKQRKAVAHAT
jgi:hypothetical protein